MVDFQYQKMFPVGEDTTEYRLLTKEYVSLTSFEGTEISKIAPEGLTFLAEQALKDVSFLLCSSHLAQVARILDDPESSDNERYVALELLKNAVISAEGLFPMCQDTGTAIIIGKKGQRVWTGCLDEEALSRGVFNAYAKNNLRYSQNAALTMFEEINTKCNLPAQIELSPTTGDEYKFLIMAKGGGSSNKTFLYQEAQPIFDVEKLLNFMESRLRTIGTAACPPYHLVFVVGGTSADMNLRTLKLATSGYLDTLPTKGNKTGHAIRDTELEAIMLRIARYMGIGAQFGGRNFCHDVRIIRLPRHGGSCPIGVGVGCSADRHIKAKITMDGIFLEQLETNPAKYLPEPVDTDENGAHLDLDRPMDEIRSDLSRYPIATRLLLSGKMVVARDMAHARFKERLDNGEGLPEYLKNHVLYYAGPAKTPKGYASGSLGPTTGGRMDPYVPLLQEQGGSLVMLAKGNRSKEVTNSCKKYGGFYLGSIGGVSARLGRDCVTSVKVIEYPEFGMEAVFLITVKDFPVFVIVDDKGNDFFEQVLDLPFAFSVKPDII